MEMIFCPNCNKRTGFKRALGFGTLFMVVITLGFWLLVIPLYPARCMNCGLARGSAFWENLGTNPREAVTASSIIGILIVIFIVWMVFSDHTQTTDSREMTLAESGQATDIHVSEPAASASKAAPAADGDSHELRLVPNLSGTGATSDGRTYSVALIASYHPDIPVGTELFAQGTLTQFSWAGIRSRQFAIIADEQQPGRTLFCAMMEDEAAEVLSLYHVREVVQVSGEYMGNFNLAGNPSAPVLSHCHVAGPTNNVVRSIEVTTPQANTGANFHSERVEEYTGSGKIGYVRCGAFTYVPLWTEPGSTEVRLRCNEPVTILGNEVRGLIRVKTTSGQEGYVVRNLVVEGASVAPQE